MNTISIALSASILAVAVSPLVSATLESFQSLRRFDGSFELVQFDVPDWPPVIDLLRLMLFGGNSGMLYGGFVGDELNGQPGRRELRALAFAINARGTGYQKLHDFTTDFSVILHSDGFLYGVTSGSESAGNDQKVFDKLFKLAPDGSSFSVLHQFDSLSDGQLPAQIIAASNGVPYGIAFWGRITDPSHASGVGVIFEFDTRYETYRVLHRFRPSGTDGFGPRHILLSRDGNLYGTADGGLTDTAGYSYGVLFTIRTADREFRVLHRFGESAHDDGMFPSALLEASDSTIYGVTQQSLPFRSEGCFPCPEFPQWGGGTIYALSTNPRAYRVIHDPQEPCAIGPSTSDLVEANGNLYGFQKQYRRPEGSLFVLPLGGSQPSYSGLGPLAAVPTYPTSLSAGTAGTLYCATPRGFCALRLKPVSKPILLPPKSNDAAVSGYVIPLADAPGTTNEHQWADTLSTGWRPLCKTVTPSSGHVEFRKINPRGNVVSTELCESRISSIPQAVMNSHG